MNRPYWGSTEPPKPPVKADKPSPPQGKVSESDGHVWFYKDVTQESIADLVDNLHKAAIERRIQAVKLGLDAPPPIHLHIHSYGGEVFAGFAAADAILSSPVPIHTHIEGGAASAATLFSVCGTRRTIGKFSFILIHQLSSLYWGKYEELKDEMKNNDLLMDRIRRIYQERTKLEARVIEDILKHDLWYDAAKALECGLVDEVR